MTQNQYRHFQPGDLGSRVKVHFQHICLTSAPTSTINNLLGLTSIYNLVCASNYLYPILPSFSESYLPLFLRKLGLTFKPNEMTNSTVIQKALWRRVFDSSFQSCLYRNNFVILDASALTKISLQEKSGNKVCELKFA